MKSYEARFSSCIIVHNEYLPVEIFRLVSLMVQPGAPIVVYHTQPEPLVELQEMLLGERQAVNVLI